MALILSQTHSYKETPDSMDPVKTVFGEQARKPLGGCSNENSKPCLSSPELCKAGLAHPPEDDPRLPVSVGAQGLSPASRGWDKWLTVPTASSIPQPARWPPAAGRWGYQCLTGYTESGPVVGDTSSWSFSLFSSFIAYTYSNVTFEVCY